MASSFSETYFKIPYYVVSFDIFTFWMCYCQLDFKDRISKKNAEKRSANSKYIRTKNNSRKVTLSDRPKSTIMQLTCVILRNDDL